MSRDFGRLISEQIDARHRRLAAFAAVLVAFAGDVQAGDGDPAVLSKPNEMPTIVSTPSVPVASAPVVSASPTPPPSTGQAVLALPGITAPAGTRPANPQVPTTLSPFDDETPGGLQLDAPSEMNRSPTQVTPQPRVSPSRVPSTSRSPRPLILEDSFGEPVPIDSPANLAKPDAKKVNTSPRLDPQPQRRGRLFGLLPGPQPTPAPSRSTNSARAEDSIVGRDELPGRSIVESDKIEASAELALKRRIEKQARESVGDRVRSIEVRVVGKTAVVQARGVKLFQKRNVRKSLESLPALSGLRSSIEVLD
jgi:hypothetical protein